MSTIFRDRSGFDATTSRVEAPSRIMDYNFGKSTFRPGLLSQDSNRLSMQFANSSNVDYRPDQSHRTSVVQRTTFGMRPLGLQTQNITSNASEIIPEESFRLNHDTIQRNNNVSAFSKTFWPAVRNTTLTTGLQMQDRVRINNDIMDSSVFHRPTLSREIRGRNSTLSSRLFHPPNTDRHYKDLSNINGFNVSHISRRDVNHMSESRFALQSRSNCVDNQSLSGSAFSAASMKAQFMNLLENLHHSILSIGPHLTSEAVRLQFDKAKQGLENISEMSFAPSVRPADAASVISQSCKSICGPPINESTAMSTINGGHIHLRSSNDLLKSLVLDKKKHEVLIHTKGMGEKDEIITSSQNNESDDEQNSSLVFKKPRPYTKKGKGTSVLKIKAPAAVKNLISKGTSKVINLTQWYPVAVGTNLAFCGVDEKGESVKTDAVKKRLNNRKVELISGLSCNLIGSPSPTISALPQTIAKFLKNGLTERWKVFQKQLLNCQISIDGEKSRKSKSPAVKRSQGNESKVNTPEENDKKVNFKVRSTPKKKGRKVYTRSGRAVKPPSMFWLVAVKGERESIMSESSESEENGRKSYEKSPAKKSKKARSLSPRKKAKKAVEESPRKRDKNVTKESPRNVQEVDEESPRKRPRKVDKESPRKAQKVDEESPRKRLRKRDEESLRKNRKEVDESPSRTASEINDTPRNVKKGGRGRVVASSKKKQSKAKSPKESNRREGVNTSLENENLKMRHSPAKRKREVTGDTDSVQAKKMKNELTPSPRSSRRKRQAKNKKEPAKKKTVKSSVVMEDSINQADDFAEMENNCDFNLDDIGIPEITNIRGNPQLSRSQLRMVSMETPPLKYFNSNLKLMRNATPVQSPDWFMSQRTESEVKQFQKRREEAFRKKITTNVTKTVITEKSKNVQSKDVKKMLEWLDEKTVKSPQWTSKVLQYVIPSRRQMEEEEDDKDFET